MLDQVTTIVLICVAIPMTIPIVVLWTGHQRRMAEIKARMGNASTPIVDALRAEMAALRQEMAGMRDTSTRFDVGLDASITRLEQRVDRMDSAAAPEIPPLTFGMQGHISKLQRA